MRQHGSMAKVHLSGQLVCRDNDDVSVVVEHLARRIVLTRAEVGCVSFCVTPLTTHWCGRLTTNCSAMLAGAFRAHQDRVAGSE